MWGNVQLFIGCSVHDGYQTGKQCTDVASVKYILKVKVGLIHIKYVVNL